MQTKLACDGAVSDLKDNRTAVRVGTQTAQSMAPNVDGLLEKNLDTWVAQYLPIVHQTARQMRARLPQHIEISELISAGTVGLLEALQKEPLKHAHFEAYARLRVRGAMIDFLRTLDWSPRELRKKARELKRVEHTLVAALGRRPEASEIAAALGVPVDEYHRLAGELERLSVETLQRENDEEHGASILDRVPASEIDGPLALCLRAELRGRLQEAVHALPEKERLVLLLRYSEELPVKEIAASLGVVESRVSQIHRSAIARLRLRLQQGGNSEKRSKEICGREI